MNGPALTLARGANPGRIGVCRFLRRRTGVGNRLHGIGVVGVVVDACRVVDGSSVGLHLVISVGFLVGITIGLVVGNFADVLFGVSAVVPG